MVLHNLKTFASTAIATTLSIGVVSVGVVQSVSAIPSTHVSSDQLISQAEPTTPAPSTRPAASAEVMKGKVVNVVNGYWVRIRLEDGEFVAVPLEKGVGDLDLNQGATIYVRMSDGQAVAMASSESAFSQVASASDDSLMQRVREARVEVEQRQTVQQQVTQERMVRPAPAPAPAPAPVRPTTPTPAQPPVRGLW